MQSLFCRFFRGLSFALALVVAAQNWVQGSAPAAMRPTSVGERGNTTKKSGYALDETTCGTAPNEFPKVRIGMRPGYCAGLVASKEDGLKFPRSIVQVPNKNLFVVADMGGFDRPNQGRLLLLDPEAREGKRLKVLMTRLDLPHALAVGIDHRLYVSTVDRVFRFDPLAKSPDTTVEVILQNLPGRRSTLSDGTTVAENDHPLKQFVFDRTGRIYVNIGAPSDNCIVGGPILKRCAAGDGAAPLAAIWAFTPPAPGIFQALNPGDPNPPREIYARGLRNSMALAVHPEFPTDGFAFLQGENGRDFPDTMEPNEELNAIENGRHYGWPYCYDLTTTSPEFKAFLETKTEYQKFCTDSPVYKRPLSLMPPHAAPLGMLYYHGAKFPELEGKLVVGLHGYRPTGSRVIVYDVDVKGFPIVSPPPVYFHLNCTAESMHSFGTELQAQVPAARFDELISGWYKVSGVRPRGAPVAITVASDGALWLVEDRNQTIIRIDTEPPTATEELPCDARSEAQIGELLGFVARDHANAKRLSQIRAQLIEKHCVSCHSDFGLKPGMTDAQKDAAVLRFMLSQDGWIYPGDPDAGRMHRRVWGKGAERMMPPDGLELFAKYPAYKQLLSTLDEFVATMVPGERRRLKLGQRVELSIRNRANKICGSLPNNAVVIVVDKRSKEKPQFSRIFRPADRYLYRDCSENDGYYVDQKALGDI